MTGATFPSNFDNYMGEVIDTQDIKKISTNQIHRYLAGIYIFHFPTGGRGSESYGHILLCFFYAFPKVFCVFYSLMSRLQFYTPQKFIRTSPSTKLETLKTILEKDVSKKKKVLIFSNKVGALVL